MKGDHWDQEELKANRALWDHEEDQDQLVHKENEDPRVHQAPEVYRVDLAQADLKDLQGQEDLQEKEDLKAN